MISKKELMLRIIDLEAIVLELDDRLNKSEHPNVKKTVKKASKK